MSYISLYRKYRSQTFDDVIGQDHVVRTIKNAIKAGRVSQGYLFCGSRGTGKTTVARLIAKALNCMESPGPTPDPCNKCEACLSITGGSAVDVVEIDAASNRGIDDVRAITENIKYGPMRLRYKVYIIDEAHQVTREAKDAFLKTLEEPPPHAVFILATTEAGKIPITIRSRCQQFDFRRGTVGEIDSRLRYVIESEGIKAEEDAIDLIARTAAGSYRDALSVLEQVVAYTEGTVTAKDIYTVIGAVDEDVLLELGDVVASADTSAAFDLADRLMREGGDVRELLRSAANHFRDLLALKVGADSHHSGDARWRAQSEKYSQERLVHIIDVFSGAEKELRWNEQHRLGLEMALLRSMARPREREEDRSGAAPSRQQDRSGVAPSRQLDVEPAAEPVPVASEDAEPIPVPLAKGDDRGSEPTAEPVREPAPQPPQASAQAVEVQPEQAPAPEPSDAAAKPATLGDIQRNWPKILAHLSKVMRKVSEGATACEGSPVELKGSLLTIGFAARHKFHQERTEKSAGTIAEAVQAVMGMPIKVNAIVMSDHKDEQPVESAAGPSDAAKPSEHPQKNDILTMFSGTEVEPGADPWQEET